MGLVPTLVGWRKSLRDLLPIQRRSEKERRPLIRTALKINYPPVLLNNQLGNREPQTIATHLRLLLDFKLPHVRARHKENILDNRNKLLHSLTGIPKILLLFLRQLTHMALKQQIDKAIHRV